MDKNKILLYEKQVDKASEVCNTEDGKTYFVRGNRIFRVVKPIFDSEGELIAYNEIAQYDANEDRIDLTELKKYVGYNMVSVDFDNIYKKFEWNTVTIEDFSEDGRIFTIKENRKCKPEEVVLLNQVFPEYYDNAFFIDNNGKTIRPSDC